MNARMLNTSPHYLFRRARNLAGEYHPDKFQFRNFGVTWALREHGLWELIVDPIFDLYCLDISGYSKEYVANRVQKVRDELSYDNALNFQGFWYALEIEVVKKEYRSKLSSLGKKGRKRQHESIKKAHELKIEELNAKAVSLAEKSGLSFFSMPGLDEDDANDTAAYYPIATDYSPNRTVYSYRFIMSASDKRHPNRYHDDAISYSGPIPLVYVRMMNTPILEHRTYEEVERLLKEPELRKDDLRKV